MTPGRIAAIGYGFVREDVDWITERIHDLLDRGDHLTMSTHGELLATDFAAYCGVPHAVAVQSGTAALEIALRALDVDGGEVVVPTNTFGATPVAVLRAGATPVFADTADDLSVDVDDVAARITPRTGAVIAVHIGGIVSPRIDELVGLCTTAGLPLVEDAAHAAGAVHDGRRAGSFGVAAAFSFFSTKVMTSGEGGMVTTRDPAIRDRALLLRDHAKNPDGTMSTTGYNWRLSEFQAIVGRAQLRGLERMIAVRESVISRYDQVLAESAAVRLPERPTRSRPNGYKYPVFLGGVDPGHVRDRMLAEHGVTLGGEVYRVPCHGQPAFARFADGPYPGADRYCATHLCPPTHPAMSEADADHVARSLLRVVEDAAT